LTSAPFHPKNNLLIPQSIRSVQIMLDRDLAIFYGVKPIRLREQVKRNIKRFPSDFMFQLTEEEVDLMVSQNAIPSKQHLGGSLPFVFTEQGVATISAVPTSERAIEINIQIMRAFGVDYTRCEFYKTVLYYKIEFEVHGISKPNK